MLREVGEAGADRPRSPRARRPADRHGAGRAAVGLAVRLPAGRAGPARARARPLRAREADRRGLRAGDPAGAGARARAVRDRLPARHRAADLPRCPRTTCTWSGPRRWRSPRCTATRSSPPTSCPCATPASRPASGARPARPGKDTRGIFRVHQFDKVEMFSFVAPEMQLPSTSGCSRSRSRSSRSSRSPTGWSRSRSTTSAPRPPRSTTVEAWLPGQGRYRELTSCSNTTDYQARRLDIRYRAADGKPANVYTLNGTAVAVGRTIIALLENGQRDDGSVTLPAPLARYGAPEVLAPATG